jgi:medium-chain acyl-[acyl-carrier-protein] hydrolase
LNPRVTEERYRVRYYELTSNWKASIASIMDYFNDVVTLQSVEVGHDVETMRFSGYAWLLLRWEIDIQRFPDFMEDLLVRTVPYSMNKFYAYRRFEVIDGSGAPIVHGKSQWILIDASRRRPVRIADKHYEVYGLSKDFNEPLEFEDLPEPETPDLSTVLKVRQSDLDTNGHANNVSYVRWIMQTVPEDFESMELKKLCIQYKHESMKGEEVLVESSFEDRDGLKVGLHMITSSGKKLAVAGTKWL